MQEADKCVLGGIAIITAILMTTNDALAEAMIDRAAKPYFVAGGVIATAFFISVGAKLIRKGNRYLRVAAAAAQWPVVAGKVLSVEIVERIDKTEDGPSKVFVSGMSTMRMALAGMEASSGLVWKIAAICSSNRLASSSPSIQSVQQSRCDVTRRTPQ